MEKEPHAPNGGGTKKFVRSGRIFRRAPHTDGMICYYCEKNARAICRFCGAGVCPDHTRANRFVSGWAAEGRADNIVVFNAIWCGRCAVQPMYMA